MDYVLILYMLYVRIRKNRVQLLVFLLLCFLFLLYTVNQTEGCFTDYNVAMVT